MRKFIKDLLTGKDNDTYDLGRLLWILGMLVFLGLCITELVMGKDFSPTEYGIGLGSVLAAGGIAIGIKKSAEPEDKKKLKREKS